MSQRSKEKVGSIETDTTYAVSNAADHVALRDLLPAYPAADLLIEGILTVQGLATGPSGEALMAIDYAGLAATARRLIDENGRDVSIVKDNARDVARPWADGGETSHDVRAVQDSFTARKSAPAETLRSTT